MSGRGSSRFERADFAVEAETLARRLLGHRLVHVVDGRRCSGRIVETEAYLGAPDLASHAAGGRRTERTEPMWGAPGLAYVYVSYGMHHCMNAVCGDEGEASAVLIRALAPEEGVETMRRRRSRRPRKASLRDRDLCSGPGKLCEALGIDRSRTGWDMTAQDRLFVERAERVRADRIARTPRIGLADLGEWTSAPLRFVLRDDPNVSRP